MNAKIKKITTIRHSNSTELKKQKGNNSRIIPTIDNPIFFNNPKNKQLLELINCEGYSSTNGMFLK